MAPRAVPRVLAVLAVLGGFGTNAAALDGDPARGAALVANRTQALCVLCHAVPGVVGTQTGTIGPPLHGVGARLSTDDLRQRLVAPEQANPDTVMPSYRRTQDLTRVAPVRRDQPLMDEQQVEDVVSYLATLK